MLEEVGTNDGKKLCIDCMNPQNLSEWEGAFEEERKTSQTGTP